MVKPFNLFKSSFGTRKPIRKVIPTATGPQNQTKAPESTLIRKVGAWTTKDLENLKYENSSAGRKSRPPSEQHQDDAASSKPGLKVRRLKSARTKAKDRTRVVAYSPIETPDGSYDQIQMDKLNVGPSRHRIDKDTRISTARDTLGLLQAIQNDIAGETTDATHSHDLPLSPLMHPTLIKARSRYHEEKPLPGADATEFEKAAAVNPFAKLLASPVRTCTMTGARLPAAFLTPFTLRKHPQTGQPWEVPKGFHPIDYERKYVREDSLQDGSPTSADPPAYGGLEELAGNEPSPQCVPSLPSCYVLFTQEALDKMSSLKQRTFERTIPNRWKKRFGFQTMKEVVWRKDMGRFVLELMRKRAMRQLAYISDQGAPSVVPWEMPPSADGLSMSTSLKIVLDQDQTSGAAVVWLGSAGSNSAADGIPAVDRKKAAIFGPNGNRIRNPVIRNSEQGIVPAFDAEELVGGSNLTWLRKHNPIFNSEIVVIRYTHAAIGVLGALWRLASYMAEGSGNGKNSSEP